MADVADIYFRVDKSELDGAAQSLGGVSNAAKKVERASNRMSKKMVKDVQEIQNILKSAKSFLVGFAGAFVGQHMARGFLQAADAANQLRARMRLVTESTDEYNAAMTRVRQIARSVDNDVSQVAETFFRSVGPMKQLGLSSADALDITEALALSLDVSGASAQAQSSAIEAMSRAMATGTLRGMEFQTVLKNSDRFATALEDALGVTRARLMEMAGAGELTTEQVAKVASQLGVLREEALSLPPKMIDGFNRIANEFVFLADEINQAYDITGRLVAGLTWVADNLEDLVQTAVRLAKVVAGIYGLRLLRSAALWLVELVKQAAQMRLNAILAKDMGIATEKSLTRAQQASMAFNATLGVLGVALAAWQLGSWLRENFQWVERFSINLVGVFLQAWETIKLGGIVAWEGIKATAKGAVNVMREQAGALIGQFIRMAEALDVFGLADGAIDRLRAIQEVIVPTESAWDGFTKAVAEAVEKTGEAATEIEKSRKELLSFVGVMDDVEDDLSALDNAGKKAAGGAKAAGDAAGKAAKDLKKLYTVTHRVTDVTDDVNQMLFDFAFALEDEAGKAMMNYEANLESIAQLEEEWLDLGPLTEDQMRKINRLRELAVELYEQEADAAEKSTDAARELESVLRRFDNIGLTRLRDDMEAVRHELQKATDPEQIARLQRALAGLRQETLAYAHQALGEGISSLQSMATQGSKAYAALETAQAALNLSTAIGAIANQGLGDPYTAFARIAAMAAMMSQLVDGLGSLRGGMGGSAAARQQAQGTGTVLGAPDAKSESIARAIEITANATQQLVGINRGMLRAMESMAAGLAGASGLLARGAGGLEFGGAGAAGLGSGATTAVIGVLGGAIGLVLDRVLGGALGGLVNKIIGGRSSVTDEGILIMGGALSEMIENMTIGAYQEVRSRRTWFSSTRTRTETQALDDAVAAQFQLVLGSMVDAVRAGAEALGLDMDAINAAIDAFRIEEIRISTMDLSAEEAQAELEAVFSSIFDGLVGSVIPWVGQFQQVGEGLGETLIRVATGVQVTREAVTQLGFALDEADPERFAIISESLMGLMGGIDGFIEGMGTFVNAFATEEHKMQIATDALTSAFGQFGLTVPESREAMWDLMQTLDATTEEGREQIAMLLQLAGVADQYFDMLESRTQQLAAIDQALEDNAWSLYLDGLTDAQRETAELARYYDDLEASLREASATTEQLAELEDQRATAMARLLAAQAEALAQAEDDYRGWLQSLIDDTQGLTDYQQAMRDASRWQQDAVRTANEHARAAGQAGASEQALALIELRASQLRAQALAQLREETESLIDQLYGGQLEDAFSTGMQGAINAGRDYWESQRRAAETLQQYLDSMLLGDLSALTPAEQLAEAWDQLNAAVDAGDAQQATQLADVYLRMLRDMTASGDDFNQGFWGVRELLEGMLADIGEIPGGGADSSGLITVAGAEQIAAKNRLDLAVQLAEHLADLSEAVGQTVFELMDDLGVDLRQLTADLGISLETITGETVLALVNMTDLLGVGLLDLTDQLGLSLTDLGGGIRELAEQTGINLDALTVESVQALGGLANQLGIDLADIAVSVGQDLGRLADDQSLLNEALRGELIKLPRDQAIELSGYLDAIEAATTDADANAAIALMTDYINELAPDIRNLLAPYFAGVFPADALADLDYLMQISTAADTTNTLLNKILLNISAGNAAAGIPAYASGGWVNGPTTLLAGERGRELILPNAVSEFFARTGIPINAGGGDNREVVQELRSIGQRLDALERATRAGADKVAATVATGDDKARSQRDQLARRSTERSTRYG